MELYQHVRVVLSILVAFSLTHLLKGVARLIQHPGRERIYWVHLSLDIVCLFLPDRILVVGVPLGAPAELDLCALFSCDRLRYSALRVKCPVIP